MILLLFCHDLLTYMILYDLYENPRVVILSKMTMLTKNFAKLRV